eukprot:6202764-Pleurochrysis_carterae.AAC.3
MHEARPPCTAYDVQRRVDDLHTYQPMPPSVQLNLSRRRAGASRCVGEHFETSGKSGRSRAAKVSVKQ